MRSIGVGSCRVLGVGLALALAASCGGGEARAVKLPAPRLKGEVSVEEAVAKRRSVRAYAPGGLSLQEAAQLLWAAQGVTDPVQGFRAAPSAGATFPLEVFLVAGQVEGLAPGVYRYRPRDHALEEHLAGDARAALERASLEQGMVRDSPACVVLAAVPRRTTLRYRERGIRYVHIEVGHVGQNLYLQAQALGLATVAIGAFHDDAVQAALRLEEEPLYLMPVGRPAKAP